MVRKTHVKPHERKKPKGGKTNVRGHMRWLGKKVKNGFNRIVPDREMGGSRERTYAGGYEEHKEWIKEHGIDSTGFWDKDDEFSRGWNDALRDAIGEEYDEEKWEKFKTMKSEDFKEPEKRLTPSQPDIHRAKFFSDDVERINKLAYDRSKRFEREDR